MPSTTLDTCVSTLAPIARSDAFEGRAEKALASYFARPPADRTGGTHTTVATLLATLKAHHRAALAMRYTPRAWPQALSSVCGAHTSLIVRLYCADHPTVGNTATLEAAAALKLAASLNAGEKKAVNDLQVRAIEHFLRAEAAFLKALETHCSAAR